MEEERRCQDPHRLCANNCGFFGNPATNYLCSKCYHDLRLAEEQAENALIAVEKSLEATTSKSGSAAVGPAAVSTVEKSAAAVPAAEEPKQPAGPSRCASPICNKKVGVIGFKCKCGEVYCRDHRLPEKHECNFDYKSLGREKIEKANLVVKANKLHKI